VQVALLSQKREREGWNLIEKGALALVENSIALLKSKQVEGNAGILTAGQIKTSIHLSFIF